MSPSRWSWTEAEAAGVLASVNDVVLPLQVPDGTSCVQVPNPPFAAGSTPVTPVVSETFVMVLVDPEIDLFVKVKVLVSVARVVPVEGTLSDEPPVVLDSVSICLITVELA